MQTTFNNCFKTEGEGWQWIVNNCHKCLHGVTFEYLVEHQDESYRCQMQAEIEGQLNGLYEVSIRAFKTAQKPVCSFKNLGYRKQTNKKYKETSSAGVQLVGDVLNKRKKSGRQVAKTAPVLSDFSFMSAPSCCKLPMGGILTTKLYTKQ